MADRLNFSTKEYTKQEFEERRANLPPVAKSDWEIRQEIYHRKTVKRLLSFLESAKWETGKWETGSLMFPAGKLHILDLRDWPDLLSFFEANPTCGWESYAGIRWQFMKVDELRNLYVEAEYWVY